MDTKRTDRGGWLIVGTLATLAVGYAYFGYLPTARRITGMRAELAEKRMVVSEIVTLIPALRAAAEELDRTRKYNLAWDKSAPPEQQLADLFGRINALAESAGATTLRFEPQTAGEYDSLRRIPVAMTCSGSFGQLAKFLHGLECLPEIIWVEKLQIKPAGENGENAECEIILAVFSDNSVSSDQVKSSG